MALTASNNPTPEPAGLAGAHTERLLALAREAVEHGLREGVRLAVDPQAHPEALRVIRGSFVTLERSGWLRGCIGSLEGSETLVEDIARNAYSAAFNDPRFGPLGVDELPELTVEITLLSPLEPIEVADETALLASLRPGIDGLLIEMAGRRATFLPRVWDSLPEPADFLGELKRKAGLPADFAGTVNAWRYTAEALREY